MPHLLQRLRRRWALLVLVTRRAQLAHAIRRIERDMHLDAATLPAMRRELHALETRLLAAAAARHHHRKDHTPCR